MIETVSVIEFLRTGLFGEFKAVYFGMNREKLTETLGVTEWQHFTSRQHEFPSIYKYDKVEFYFEEGKEGRLYGIQIMPTIKATDALNLKIDYGFIHPDLGYEAALQFLDSASIKYTLLESELDSDDVRRIETTGKVQLIFSEDYDQRISIHKVSKFVTLHPSQSRLKQVNFSIALSEFNKLKSLASSNGKSIQEMCREIVTDYLGDQFE